ncbi:GNAT family N-acetyltransferase [Mesorhizobium australicum]|uniref:N-acetyltransferase domain-containing protein n=1 Tax=Mesorhizobium australicum TaxID=536018 RepID=A0A1X7PS51_9HYPH|nr:GNAT family N-acetyltransferase [Mesorhizobium australicum]SMH53974.1 hypothetical protein SAMN02982922_4983 [Mesorhizobium australicum]
MTGAPEIRPLSPAEVETLVGWAAAEGWNPGLGDAAAFRVADPDGFLGAFVGGEMVAGIAAIAYGDDFGFIGLYICRSDQRGKGYGKAVWDAGMTRLSGRTIGLDGVPAQQANYRSMGFEPAYRTLRFSGRVAASDAPCIRPVTPDLSAAIHEFDRMCFPAVRNDFLVAWLGPPRISLASVANGIVRGFGVARACGEGHKIGPLFARDEKTAAALLASLATTCGSEVHIDVPEARSEFIDGLIALGFTSGFETARMYRGDPPAYQDNLVFGVTCLELG